jgi:hypothetical protein
LAFLSVRLALLLRAFAGNAVDLIHPPPLQRHGRVAHSGSKNRDEALWGSGQQLHQSWQSRRNRLLSQNSSGGEGKGDVAPIEV